MRSLKQRVYDVLNEMEIPYDVTEHVAVYTIEDMEKLNLGESEAVPKNLFLRDDKKKRFFLLVLHKDKTADLKKIRELLGTRPLSFGSEESLMAVLGLPKGSVTPFGILNDGARTVEVIFDEDLRKLNQIGIHPNDNTATVWLRMEDLLRVIRSRGNKTAFIQI